METYLRGQDLDQMTPNLIIDLHWETAKTKEIYQLKEASKIFTSAVNQASRWAWMLSPLDLQDTSAQSYRSLWLKSKKVESK